MNDPLSSFLFLMLFFSPIIIGASWGWAVFYIAMTSAVLFWHFYKIIVFLNSEISHELILINGKYKTLKHGRFLKKTKIVQWKEVVNREKQIDLLVYYPSYSFDSYLDKDTRKTHRGLVQSFSRLVIHRGSQEYVISHKNISETELHWLGQELSDFLNLELQIIYPLPKVHIPSVAEATCSACGCC